MKKFFIFPISLFLFLALFVFPARAENIVPDGVEHATEFDVAMNINSDSTISVTETINYDFGMNTKLGITRYIPLNYQNLSGNNFSIGVADISVTDENGSPYVFSQSRIKSDDKKKAYLKIDIGDGNQLVTGTKNYILHYTVSGALKYLNDHDELFWNVTGDKWPVYVRHPEVKISLPQKVDRDAITKECFMGLHAATIECIDQLENKKGISAYYTYKGAVAGQSMTVILGFPKGLVQNKLSIQHNFWSVLKTDRRVQGISLLSILLLIALIILVIIYFKKITEFFSWQKWSNLWRRAVEKIKLAHTEKIQNKSRKRWVIVCIVLAIFLISGGIVFWKVGNILNKISVKRETINSFVHAGVDNQTQIKGESDDRINILLLGILGANHPGGGLNTDTIMVASIKPKANKVSMISIPRDLWVTDPGKDTNSKINAVYEYGEEKGTGQGIIDMESLISEITGLPIHYTAVVSTQSFAQLVDTLGGVEVDLSKPFDESAQYADTNVCDADTYTIPTGEFQNKKNDRKRVVARYPICKNKNPECGGEFHLPAGKNNLNGEQALCFVRSRYLTSDFERAKRQQLLLEQLKKKVTQLGLSDFGKVNSILNTLGDNVRTDMQLWEMRRLLDLYKGMDSPQIYQRVLEDTKEGLLTTPDSTPETGFILLPRSGDYSKIRNLFQNIFDTGGQSDIKPNI